MKGFTVARNLPRTTADVTAAWLTEALEENYPGVVVTSCQTDPTLGYKPTKRRVHLTYNEAGHWAGLPSSMIVKATFPGDAPTMDFATAAEVLAYRDLVPKLGVNTPRCFYIGIDWANSDAAMVMEDLALRNVTFLNAGTPLSYDRAAAFLDVMAKIHARFWDGAIFAEGGEFAPSSTMGQSRHRLYTEFLQTIIKPAWWDKYRQEPRATAMPRALVDQSRIEAAWERMQTVVAGSALVAVHGDEHLGNMFLEADGRPGLIDWFGRAERWPIAFAYFLCNSLDILDRRHWERPLLAYYLGRLAFYGAAAPSFEEAWFAYRAATVFPWVIWYTNPGAWQPEWINVANGARAGFAMLDHDVLGLLGV